MTDLSLVFKDATLDRVALDGGNVAQFVSFSSELQQRFCRVRGYPANHPFDSPEQAIRQLHSASRDRKLNIRTFSRSSMQGNPFVFDVGSAEDALGRVRSFADDGWTVLVNETLRVDDGGVSGVLTDEVMEIVPADTPRGVEQPGAAALPADVGRRFLTTVYGDEVELPRGGGMRTEFSVHVGKVGWLNTRTVIWEVQKQASSLAVPSPTWPNRLSKFVGDKAYGLLIASLFGARVPRALVVGRRVPPFEFGLASDGKDHWIRTCPVVTIPGKFTTRRGWMDPFRLMAAEDPSGELIQSVIWQAGIDAQYAGGAFAGPVGEPIIEGVAGTGEDFMLGTSEPVELPESVRKDVTVLLNQLVATLSFVRIEWAHDGSDVWIIQLHASRERYDTFLTAGDALTFVDFDPADGLEKFRSFARRAAGMGVGVRLTRQVGLTSHFGDVARRYGVVTKF